MLKQILNKYKSLPIHIKSSFWFLLCGFLSRGISFITVPIFTRLMSTDEYGQYNVFNSWFGIVSVIITLNLFYGVYFQGLVKFEEKRNEYSSTLQGLCFTLVTLWTVIYLLFHDFFNSLFSLSTVQMLCMLSMCWTGAVFNFWSADKRNDYKYKKLLVITVIVIFAKPILGIILVLNWDDKVTARIFGLAIVELTAYIGLFFSQMVKGKKFCSLKIWKYALTFAVPLVPHYLSGVVLSSSDRIMIEKMSGFSEAGIYSLAYSVSQIMTMFNSALLSTTEPWLYKKIKNKQINSISAVAMPMMIFVAGINIVLIAFAPEIIHIFAPAEYHDSIYVIPPVTMSVFFTFLYSFFVSFEFYYEKKKYITVATCAGAVLNIILNAVFINIFGYYAAGYTTLICYIIYAACHYIFMRKICKDNLNDADPFDLKKMLLISSVFLLIGFVLLFTYSSIFIRYGLIVILLLTAIIKRNSIMNFIKEIINIRNQK